MADRSSRLKHSSGFLFPALVLWVSAGACSPEDAGRKDTDPLVSCPGGCPIGQRCAQGSCVTGCTTAADCGSGRSCTAGGECVASTVPPPPTTGGSSGIPVGQGGGSGTGPAAGGVGGGCARLDAELTRVIPNVVLLIDRSGSMALSLSTTDGQRWSAVRNLLVDPSSGLVARFQADVNFGLVLYTGPDNGMVGNPGEPTTTCPVYAVGPLVPGSVQDLEELAPVYLPEVMEDPYYGATPTGESLAEVAGEFARWADPNQSPKIIVLATDGEPGTCEDPSPDMGADTEARIAAARNTSIQAAQNAFTSGITTFVLGVATAAEALQAHLDQLANAGQGQDPATGPLQHFPANSTADIELALTTIINGSRSCVFDLDGTIEGDAGRGTVLIDGDAVTYNDANGWRANSPTQVEFVGSSCDVLKTGDRQIQMSFPCDVFIPDPE